MTASLLLDDLDLMDEQSPFRLAALSTDAGTTWGNPDTIDTELRSFIQYGTLVETANWANRSLIIAISVTGDTMDETAANEAALVAKLHRRAALAYTPATATVATVFPVLTSTLMPTDNDLLETTDSEVIYQIKFTCAPFVRAAALETVAALASGTSSSLIEDVTTGSTGWAGSIPDAPGGTVSTVVSAAGVTVSSPSELPYASGGSYIPIILGKTFASQDTTTKKYIGIDYRLGDGLDDGLSAANRLSFYDDAHSDVYDYPIATLPSPDEPGMTRAFYQLKPTTNALTQVHVQYTLHQPKKSSGGAGSGLKPSLIVGRLIRTDTAPSLLGRQSIRSFDIKGVMPTTGSIAISHGGILLEVQLYTWPRQGNTGYVPACRIYMVSGGTTTTNSSCVSGSRTDMSAADVEYHLPADKTPDGEYLIACRVDLSAKAAADRIITLTVGASMSGSPIEDDEVLGTYDVSDQYDAVASGYQVVLLDTAALPRVKMARAAAGFTKVVVRANTGAGTAYIDELFTFNTTIGQRHAFRKAPSHLWIDSPDISNDGQPQLWCGTAADRSDAVSAFPIAQAIDIHQFDPIAGVSVYCMASGPSVPATVEFTYYPQFWSRVPPL